MVRDDLLQPKPQCSLSGHVEGKQTNVLYQKSGRKYEMSRRILNDAKNMEQCIEYTKYKWCKTSELCNGYSNGCKDKRITTNHYSLSALLLQCTLCYSHFGRSEHYQTKESSDLAKDKECGICVGCNLPRHVCPLPHFSSNERSRCSSTSGRTDEAIEVR